MTDLFISYSRRDRIFVQKLHQSLAEQGRDIWVDYDDIPPAVDWRGEIRQNIEKTNAVVFVLSPDFLASAECDVELEIAEELSKRLIPLVCQDVQPDMVPPSLKALNWIYVRERDDFNKAMAQLAEALDKDWEWVKAHTRLTERATEWEAHSHNSSYLLQGDDLIQAEQRLSQTHRQPSLSELVGQYILASRQQASRRQRFMLSAVSGALVVALVLAGLALYNAWVARRERALATSRELTANAYTNLIIDPERSILLSLEALKIAYIPETQAVLQQAVQQPQTLAILDHDSEVPDVAFSPDGTRLATVQLDGTVSLWDVEARQALWTVPGHEGEGRRVIFTGSGTRLITLADGEVKVWDAESGQEQEALPGVEGYVTSIDINPAETLLAVAEYEEGFSVWDLVSGELLFQVPAETQGEILSLNFSPDSNYLAVANDDGTAKIWDVASGEEQWTLDGHGGRILSIIYSPGGRYLATASEDNTALIWDAETGEALVGMYGHNDWVHEVAFSPDERRLATVSLDRTVRLWDAASGQLLAILYGHSNGVSGVSFSPDGTLATGSYDTTARLWAAQNNTVLSGHSAWIFGLAFSPDGTRLVTGSEDATIKLWDVRTGNELESFIGHDYYWIEDVNFSPDGNMLATAGDDGTVKLWDLQQTEKEPRTLVEGEAMYSAIFSPDGTSLATLDSEGTLQLWEVQTGEELESLYVPDFVNKLAFSPDGTRLATANYDYTAKLWEIESGKELMMFDVGEAVNDVAFSPDGQRLVTGSSDNTAKVWELQTGQEVMTLVGHTDDVLDVGFSPDGEWIATASEDQSVKIWEASSGQELVTLGGHTHTVFETAFSLDGRYLATASADKTVRLFILDQTELINTARARLSRWWTPEECRQYLRQAECPPDPRLENAN
jgi:WD40 repeat protein